MKILMLTPYLPFPLHSGGQIRSYNLLKDLSKKHQITLFSFIRSEDELESVKELEKFCSKVRVFKRRKAWDIRNIALAALTAYPFLVTIYLSKTIRKALDKELKSGQYDLIHAETFYVMPNLPQDKKTPVLLVEQTIEYLVYQRFVENFKLFFLKPFLYFDVLKIKLWEKHYWRQATRLVAMSASDRYMMQRSVAGLNIDVVANGVDVDHFNQVNSKPKKSHKQKTVLFVGNFKWLPNKDAATFLVEKIWPKITQKDSNAKLWIVGRNPTPEILKLNQIDKVKVSANVEDIRDAFNQADVLLAPIRNGRGTKYKVLEAMASGVPVVTTKLGVEGINVVNNKSVLVAERATRLAELTLRVLHKPKLSAKISKNAKQLVYNKFNWETISLELDKIYQQLGGA